MTSRYDRARLLRRVQRLEAIAREYLDLLDADGIDCSCYEGDPCPRCRAVAALNDTEIEPRPSVALEVEP